LMWLRMCCFLPDDGEPVIVDGASACAFIEEIEVSEPAPLPNMALTKVLKKENIDPKV